MLVLLASASVVRMELKLLFCVLFRIKELQIYQEDPEVIFISVSDRQAQHFYDHVCVTDDTLPL